jgi:hypothetical protein
VGVVTADDAQAALSYWSDVRVAQHAAFWTVSGVDPSGVARSGSRDDLASLIADLLAFQGLKSQEIAPEAGAVTNEAVTDEAVTDEAPIADDEPIVEWVALSFEEITNGGIMLVEDELVIRRGLAWASVSDHADALVAAIIDPNRRTELIALVAMAANKRQLGLQLDETNIEAESRFVALQAREDEIRRFERQMREAVRFASVDMLRDFDAEGAGWPT